jgi:anti-sigma28 factor (negative regulator of flagellin synthesis)
MESTETLTGDGPRTVNRRERIEELRRLIAEGAYVVPAIDIAHAILHGRPKWGERVPRPGDLRSLF